MYDALEKGTIAKIMGVRSTKNVKFNNFWKNWHRKRTTLKKNAMILFSDENTKNTNHAEYYTFFKNLPHTEIKTIHSFSPSAIMIIDNNSFLFSYDEEITCIHIQSESISKSFTTFFDGLWKIS